MFSPSTSTLTVPWAQCLAVQLFQPVSIGTAENWQAARTAYQSATGRQAPPYDPSKAVQYYDWPSGIPVLCFDQTDPQNAYVRQYTPAEFANLPGIYNYPQRVVAPTLATYLLAGVIQLVVPVNYLCSQAEAEVALAEIQASSAFVGLTIMPDWVVGEPGAAGVPEQVNISWNGETRRYYHVRIAGGGPLNLAILTASMASRGIGYPLVLGWSAPEITIAFGNPITAPQGQYVVAPFPLIDGVPPTGYAFQIVSPALFGGGSIVLAPIVPSNPTPAQKLAAMQTQLAQLTAEIAQYEAEIAAGTAT